MKKILPAAEPLIIFLILYNPFMKSGSVLEINASYAVKAAAVASIQLLLLFIFIFKIKKYTLKEMGFRVLEARDIGRTALVLGALFLTGIAGRLLLPDMGKDFLAVSGDTGLLLIPMFIVAGLAEELFFRAYMFRSFEKIISSVPAMTASALVFASGHIYQGIFNVILIFIMGLLLGYFFRKYGSIIVNTVAHFLFNFISVLIFIHFQ